MGLHVERVGFAYGRREVLAGISFDIPTGEVWGLLGRSGCGKTTLLHILAGLYRPNKGEVKIEGRSPGPGSIRGVVFQEDCLLGWLNVEANTLFPRHRIAPPDLRARARRLLDEVGLGSRRESYPYELSAGMRKRLEVVRALIADEKYFLADEPFGTLDHVTRGELWRLWRDLRSRQPRTGLLCTHDPEEALRLCDVVVTLQGRETTSHLQIVPVPISIKYLDLEEGSPELTALKGQITSLIGSEYA